MLQLYIAENFRRTKTKKLYCLFQIHAKNTVNNTIFELNDSRISKNNRGMKRRIKQDRVSLPETPNRQSLADEEQQQIRLSMIIEISTLYSCFLFEQLFIQVCCELVWRLQLQRLCLIAALRDCSNSAGINDAVEQRLYMDFLLLGALDCHSLYSLIPH